MGTPVKVYDLAERLIRLSGKTIKTDPNTQDQGAIEIKITGLRKGEKLYEELLVDADALATEHPKIMRAIEQFIDEKTLNNGVLALKEALKTDDIFKFKRLLTELVEGYEPSESE